MGKYKYLANNIALFTVSNFVSKILVFLLVPFYTNILSTADYGVGEVFQSTLLLLVPALTLNMGEAALRYGIDKSDRRRDILHIGMKYVGLSSLLVAIVCIVASVFFKGDVKNYILIFIFMFMSNCTYEFLILFFQGCEQVRIVVCGSVFSTLVLVTSNIIFLVFLQTGVYGYFLSQILSFTLAALLMYFLSRKWASFLYKPVNKDNNTKEFERELLDYSVPIIAYSTGAWINNVSDRYLVSLLKGVAVNGIYGVAYKIPSILTVFQRIFAQAWQMSATKVYTDDTSDEFFTTMYKIYNAFMVMGCAFLILVVRIVAGFLFRKEFYIAWSLVPPLLISVAFGALTGYLGPICLAHKDSKAMGFATGVGALLNVILNLLLIPKYSAMGASVATAISYFTTYMIAFFRVKKYVQIKVRRGRDIFSYLLLVVESIIMINDLGPVYIICGVIFIILLIMYFEEVKDIVLGLLKKVK